MHPTTMPHVIVKYNMPRKWQEFKYANPLGKEWFWWVFTFAGIDSDS